MFIKYMHTYHSRFISERVAEVSQIFHAHVLLKLVSYGTLQTWQVVSPLPSYCSLGVSAINPLVAFYDIHGGERCYIFILPRTPHETHLLNTMLNRCCNSASELFQSWRIPPCNYPQFNRERITKNIKFETRPQKLHDKRGCGTKSSLSGAPSGKKIYSTQWCSICK
jgi:hypothetical protein